MRGFNGLGSSASVVNSAAGIGDLEAGHEFNHEKVAKRLMTWGKPGQTKACNESGLVPSGDF